MNASVYELLERVKAGVYEALQKIEDSPVYERIVSKIESLEPSQQRTLLLSSRVLVLLTLLYFLLSPLGTLWSIKSTLNDQRTLLAEIKAFNTAIETRPRPAPNPKDWQNMSAASPNEALQNLISFMNSIGLPEGSYQTLPSSGGQLQINIPEINLRQVQTLLFQIDGWYPEVENEIVTIKTLPTDPQKLSLTLTLNHKSGQPFTSTSSTSSRSQRGSKRYSNRGSQNNVVQPDDEVEAFSQPPSFDSATIDSNINTSRPPNPTYEEFQDSGDSFSNSEAMDAAGSMDSLPPPPPLDEEF